MRVGIILISNRPDKLNNFVSSLNKLPRLRSAVEVYAAVQPPFTGAEPALKELDGFVLVENYGVPVPFTWYRLQAMLLARECDLFWSLDCDHKFDESGSGMHITQYYFEVFRYFNFEKDAGVLCCTGEEKEDYNFHVNPRDRKIWTDRGGLFLRNIGVDKIIEPSEQHLVGALFECLAAYNIMSYGYSFAKRYNAPLKMERYTTERGYKRYMVKHMDVSYSDSVLDVNIRGRIRSKFEDPTWGPDETNVASEHYPDKIERVLKAHGLIAPKIISPLQ